MGDSVKSTTESGRVSTVYQAVQESYFAASLQGITATVQNSTIYRWLTTEPEPEVIVIDLRETWTVAPVLWFLNVIFDRVRPALSDSRAATAIRWGSRYLYQLPAVVGGLGLITAGLVASLFIVLRGGLQPIRLILAATAVIGGILATRDRRSWMDFRETRLVTLLITVLEPPDPTEPENVSNSVECAEHSENTTADYQEESKQRAEATNTDEEE